uniref:NS3 protein n=1 Tax=Kammavanpettai virus TaxID=2282480 RepID=A0A3G1RP44_9REOV|nr:NS3 protein [Kammavanpettai virus]
MLAKYEQSNSYTIESDFEGDDIPLNQKSKQEPVAPPAYELDVNVNMNMNGGKTNALTLLNNAVASATGANEAQKNEKAAFGAVSEAMRDDANTRSTKVMVFKKSFDELVMRINKARRWRFCFSILRIILIIMFFGLCFMHLVIECVTVEDYKGFIKAMRPSVNTTDIETVLEITRKINLGYTIAEIAITTSLMFVTSIFNRVLEDIRTLKRDKIKKETYIQAVDMLNGKTLDVPKASV